MSGRSRARACCACWGSFARPAWQPSLLRGRFLRRTPCLPPSSGICWPSAAWLPGPRWYTIAAAGVLAAALVLSGSGASGATGEVQRDGYTVTQTWTHNQMISQLAGSSGSDAALVQTLMGGGGAAYGVNGSQAEVALDLSPPGVTLITAMLPSLQSSLPHDDTARVDGTYLVVTGPASSLTAGSLFQG
jgi:hypothetical protein